MTSKTTTAIVRKSNALARAKWSPKSVWEPRLVAILASKIRPEDTDFQIYEISIAEIIGKNYGGKDYKEIEEIVDKAMSRIITIRNEDGWKKYTLFSSCELINKKGVLKIGFHPNLKEHYLHLKQYVKFNLTDFLLLPSIYSQRLFELLKSWDDREEIILKISQLHEILDVPKSLRNKYKDFRVRVLDKAYKDINENTSLHYEWEAIKSGRSFTEIKFKFIKTQNKKTIDSQNKKTMQSVLCIDTQTKSNIKPLFDAFLAKFPSDKASHLNAGIKWYGLNDKEIAPLAEDVPEDNELGVIEFLEKWSVSHSDKKND